MHKVLLVIDNYSILVDLELDLRKLGFDVVGTSSEVSLADQVISLNPDSVVIFGNGQKLSSVRVSQKLREMSRWRGKVLLILQQGQKIKPDQLSSLRIDFVLEAPFENERIVQILARFGGLSEELLLEKFRTQKLASETEQDLQNQKKEFVVVSESEVHSNHSFHLSLDSEIEKKMIGNNEFLDESSQDFRALQFEVSSEPLAPGKQRSEGIVRRKDHLREKESSTPLSPLQQEIVNQSPKLKDRVSNYSKFLKGLRLKSPSSLQRRATRSIQNELMASINVPEMENQDELRRDFTRYLFKKKR